MSPVFVCLFVCLFVCFFYPGTRVRRPTLLKSSIRQRRKMPFPICARRLLANNFSAFPSPFRVACEQALWPGKERRKRRRRTSEETGRGGVGQEGQEEYAQLAPLADLFSLSFSTAEPVHRLLSPPVTQAISSVAQLRDDITKPSLASRNQQCFQHFLLSRKHNLLLQHVSCAATLGNICFDNYISVTFPSLLSISCRNIRSCA